MAWQPSPVAAGWVQRHPYAAAALALHGLGLALLWAAGPYQLARQQAVRDESLIASSLQQARTLQAQRRVRALEAAQRAMTGEGPAAEAPLPEDPQALTERAQTAARALQTADQQARADELARLRQLPREQALAEVRAQDERARDAAPPQGDAMAEAERQAQGALARQAERDARAAHGSPVRQAGGAAGGGEGGGERGDSRVGGSGAGTGAGTARAAGGALERGPQSATVRAHGSAASVATAATGAVHRLTRGRRLGEGGALADRVLLDTWYVVGPFDSPAGPRGQRQVEAPELGVNLDAVYAGAGGRSLRWQFVQEPGYPIVPQPRRENASYYAYTEVHSPDAREVWLDIGADDDSRLWLNEQLVWDSGAGDKPWYHQPFYTLGPALRHAGLAEGSVRVRLKPGPNRLLFKLVNGIDLMFFSVTLRP